MLRDQFKSELIWFAGIIVLAGVVFGFANAQIYFGGSRSANSNDAINLSLLGTFFPNITILLFFIIYLLRIMNENYQNFIANLIFSIANVIILLFLMDMILFLDRYKEELLYPQLSTIPHKIEAAKSRLNPMLYSSIALFIVLCIYQLYIGIKTLKTIRKHRDLSYQGSIS